MFIMMWMPTSIVIISQQLFYLLGWHKDFVLSLSYLFILIFPSGPKGAPHFVVDPQIEQSDDGRLLTFHCELVADPKPEIVWSKDDVKIKDGGRYKILIKQDGSNYDVKLQITDVSSEDAGEYKIYAANDLGDSKSRITLNFESKSNLFLKFFFKVFFLI